MRGTWIIVALLASGWAGSLHAEEPAGGRADTTGARSPRGAMLRSLALPGWGQFYNGRVFKGSVLAAAEVGSAAAFLVNRQQSDQASGGGRSRRKVFLLTAIGTLLYSMGDAYVDAQLSGAGWGTVEAGPKENGGVNLRAGVRFK